MATLYYKIFMMKFYKLAIGSAIIPENILVSKSGFVIL